MLALDTETKWKEELKHQFEAKTAKETSTPTAHPRPLIVLLDVDDTLVMSNQYQGKHDGGYHYHQPLIAALKRAGIIEVYLFTAYLLRGISKTRQDEAIGSAFRLKLIQYLTSQGLHVKGTLTLLDPVYDQGIGTYYQEVIHPFEERVLKGESLLEGEAQKLYQEAYDRELGHLKIEQALDKAKLFAYTKAQLQSLHPNLTFLCFDDTPEYLKQVEQTNALSAPLLTYLVKPQDTETDYQAALEPFLKYQSRWGALEQQITCSPKVMANFCVLNKFKKALQDIIPRSEIPLAFHKKLDHVERLWEDFLKNPYTFEPSPLSSEALEQAIRSLAIPEASGYELWGYGDEPLFISRGTALLILSEDKQGNLRKANPEGRGYVSCLGWVFFKRAAGLSTLQPLAESFIFELAQCLGGGIVAPTRLLMVRMPNGRVELVQASLRVGDLGLEQVLMIPQGIQGLQTLLGEEKLLKALPRLTSGDYFQEWLDRQSPKPDLSLEAQKAYFVQAFKKLKDRWPEDFQKQYSACLKICKGTEEAALNRALGEEALPWLKVWALIEDYPELLAEGLNNLLYLPSLFEALREVYPYTSPKGILEHAPKLLECFSLSNYSQHFLLSLLTGPNDGKGDNFRVTLSWNLQGLPQKLELIAIDNDLAFKQGFYQGKPQVRTIIYTLGRLLEQPLEAHVLAKLKETSSEMVLLKTLSKVVSLQRYYQPLIERFYRDEFVKRDALQTLSLEDFFKEGFLEEYLRLVPEIFKTFDSTPTHTELFSKYQPGLAAYYQALSSREPDPQKMMFTLYNRHDPEVNQRYDVEALLPEKLKENSYLFYLLLKPSRDRNLSVLLVSPLEKIYLQAPFLAAEAMLQAGLTPSLKSFRLSVDGWTALFALYGQHFIRWLKLFHIENEILLSFSNKPKDCLSFREPRLLIQVLPLQNLWLIEGLLIFGCKVDALGPPLGYTALQYAARLNLPNAIAPLIANGANSRLLFEGKSALVLALERFFKEKDPDARKYEATLETLIAFEVPYIASTLSLGLHYAAGLAQKNPELQTSLLLNNPELAWGYSLRAISQTEKPKNNPIMLSGLEQNCYLRSQVYQRIFKEEGFPKDNVYGRHNVTSINLPLSRHYSLGIHFKENPEFLGREIMVHELGKALFGPITPFVTILKFTKKKSVLWIEQGEQSYPVLATATVPGKLALQDVLEDPQELAKIEAESFSQVLLLTLLIKPEDGRGDNYMLRPVYHAEGYQYKLVPIDNDRAFVQPLQLKSDGSAVPGPEGLNVKTIVYCLDLMSQPLSPKVIEAFLRHNPFELLKQWLNTLIKRQERINQLFSKENHEALKSANVNLQMVFKPSIIVELYEKLKLVQHVLRENPYCSGLALLCQVLPALGYCYRDAFQGFKTPMERFEALTKGRFEVSPVKREVILPLGRVQTKTILKTTSTRNKVDRLTVSEKKPLIETPRTQEEASHPRAALARLEKVHRDAFQLEKIQQEVYQGEFKRFLELQTSYQQAILNGEGLLKPFDFSLMKKAGEETYIERQEQLLSLLANLSFTALRIYRCEALKESSLRTLLRGLRETLSALELNACENLGATALLTINLNCARLEKLGLINLSFSEKIELASNRFKSLRVLRLESCLDITECRLNVPQLERIQLIHLNLRQISTQSQSLDTIELRHCKVFPENALYELGESFSKLKKVKLVDCPLIINAFYYEQYPAFLSLSLKEGDKTTLNKVFASLHEALQKRFLVAERLNQTEAFIQTIHQVLALPLSIGLQAQTFLDSALESSHRQERLFVAQLLVSSRFRFLSTLHQEARIRQVLNSLLALAQDRTLPTEKVLALLGEVASQKFSQLSKVQQQALWKLVLELTKDEDQQVKESASKALEQVFSQGFFQLTEEDRQALWKLLLDALKDKDWRVRVAASKALERGVFQGFSQLLEGDRQALWKFSLKALKDRDWRARAAALKALGQVFSQGFSQLSEEDRQALWKLLLEVLKDKNWWIRAVASTALEQGISQDFSQLLEEDRQALWKLLLDALKDRNWQVRLTAVEALGQIFSQSFFQLLEGDRQALWKLLLGMLKDEDLEVRAAASKVLEQVFFQGMQILKGDQQACLELLLEALNDKDWRVRVAILKLLGQVLFQVFAQLRERDRQALWRLLFEVFKDKDWWVRGTASQALEQGIFRDFSQLSKEDQQACLELLFEALKDEDSDVVRATAPKALGQVLSQGFAQLREDDRQALWRFLLEALKNEHSDEDSDEDLDLRATAVEALGQVLSQGLRLSEGDRQSLWTLLLNALKDKDWRVRAAVFKALGQALSQNFSQLPGWQACLKLLLEAPKDKDWWVREIASRALERAIFQGFPQLSERDRQALWHLLFGALKDEDPDVRAAALKALGQVLSQVFSQLVEEDRQALWKLLLEALKDKDLGIRAAALKALEQVLSQVFSQLVEEDRQALWKLLLEALKDKDLEIRAAALKVLEQVLSQVFSQLVKGDRQALWDLLLEVFKDKDLRVRAAALKALGQVLPQVFSQLVEGDRQALWDLLLEAFKDKDLGVRTAALKALGQVLSQVFSQLVEGDRQALWKLLLEALKDEYSDEGLDVRATAIEVLGQVFSQGFSQLLEGERDILWKALLGALKDKDLRVRAAALKVLERVISQGFLQLPEEDRQALWKRLSGAIKELDFDTVITLGKTLASEKLIEYFSCATLSQRFIPFLETHPEIQEILNQRASTLVEASSSQGYSLYEVEKLLSVFRSKFLASQEGIESSDSPYYRNKKSCFLANPLTIEDLPKQLFETISLLLIQETPWYPKRMILPIFEQARWSVVVLEGDYEKLSFDLLWDSPANNNIAQVLPAVKSSLDRLVQSWQGSFQGYRFKVHIKHFVQQEPIHFIDSGPIIVQNIEDYLTYLGESLSQFNDADKLLTIKPFNPIYSSTLQIIRIKHRSLMVNSLPDHQLSSRALFFKYTHFPARIESLVMGYCEGEINSILSPETSPGLQGKPPLPLTVPSPNASSQTTFSSHLSDEKVMQELSEILTQLNAESISQESDNPLEGPVTSSIPSTPIISPAPVAPVGGRLLEAERKTFQEGEALFEKLLTSKQLVATKASGQGLNCFIYSLLQHVTGRYDLDKFDEPLVRRIKQKAGLGSNFIGMIYPDTPQTLNLVKAINEVYKVNLEVHFVQINKEGKPIVLPPLFDDKALGQRQPVMLWLQVNHYVAITSQKLFAKAQELVSGSRYGKSARRLSDK